MRVSNALVLGVLSLLLLLVSSFAAANGPTTAASTTTTAQLWATAHTKWQQQRMDETLALLLQIERVDPDDPMLPMALGAVYQSKVCVYCVYVCGWVIVLDPHEILLRCGRNTL